MSIARSSSTRAPRHVRSGRTQEERRADSRLRLLDATIQCLVEGGFVATTVGEVARRAGLSVGCLQNYFPTKAHMLAAAVEHLFERRRAEFVDSMRKLPESTDWISSAVDLLWSAHQRESFRPYLELLVCGQNDPELRDLFSRMQERMEEETLETIWELFEPIPESGVPPLGVVSVLLGTIQSMALSALTVPNDRDHEHGLQALKIVVRGLLRPRTLASTQPRRNAE